MRLTIGSRITFAPGFFIQLAIALLLLPANWVIGWLAAAAFHEFCHYCALLLCGVQVYTMRISHVGAFIEAEHMRPGQELITSLSGPFGSLLLLVFLRIYPEVAISALLQSAFNLLPIYPFDGGRALRVLLWFFLDREVAEVIFRYVQLLVAAVILIGSVFAVFIWKLGILPIGICLLLIGRSIPIKIPCKQMKQIVQ
jgi:stage IV sporulation protein FB